MSKKYIRPFQFILVFYALALLFFTLCRTYLLFQNLDSLNQDAKTFIPLMYWEGFRFDTAVINYSLFLPVLFSIILYYTKSFSKVFVKLLVSFFTLVFFVYLLAGLTDIGYYDYYNSRLNTGVFSWMGTPILMLKVVFLDINYWVYIIFGLLFTWWCYLFLTWLASQLLMGNYEPKSHFKLAFQSIIIAGLLMLGVRGSFNEKRPLDPSESIISKYTTINNLSINGLFNLIHSFKNREIDFFEEEVAYAAVQKYFNYKPLYIDYPLSRIQKARSAEKKKNVVLIIMESMSANQMGLYGNTDNLTPFLDSLAKQSICFPNIYTSGVHTHNGLYSTMYSQPAILDRIAIREGVLVNQHYYGLPHILKEKGFRTHFLITGDGEYDSMYSFFPQNGFDKFICQDFFEEDDVVNQWGVSDHVLFNKTIAFMDSSYEDKKPFLMTYMTISTHSPYGIPEEGVARKLKAKTREDQSYEYADWSIQQFMQQAATKPWYNETVFVFVADHGQKFDVVYDMSLAYHHCPLIIYDPATKPVSWNEKIGLQIDVFPTVMSYLNIEFENNTLGTDLFTHTRPYAYFTADDKIGVIDNEHFYIERLDGNTGLYNYKTTSLDDVSANHKDKVKAMENYSHSMLQTSYSLIEKHLVGKPH